MVTGVHALSRGQRLQCDRHSEALLGEALVAFAGFERARLDPTEWRFLARRDQFAVHRAITSKQHEGADRHKRRVLATGFLNASLTDVTTALYAETDAELLTAQALLSPSSDTVIDAAVLLMSERRERRVAPFRFAGVKWYSWKNNPTENGVVSVNGSVIDGQECDLLTYERMGMAQAEDTDEGATQELAYHVLMSLDKPEWPMDVARGPGLRRAQMALCFLFREVCDDLVECFALGDYDVRASASSQRAADAQVASRVLMVTRVADCARAKKFSGFVRKARGRPVVMGKTCLRCGSKRTVLDPHRTCSICNKSVCLKCYELKPVFALNQHTHEPETEAFCTKCLARIQSLDPLGASSRLSTGSRGSSGGGSSVGERTSKEKESHSGGSSSMKFWRKDKKQDKQQQEPLERRKSMPRTRRSSHPSSNGEGRHVPNYETLFRNYAVPDNPRGEQRKQRFLPIQLHLDLEEEREPEPEQDQPGEGKKGGLQQEKRWRQASFLANPAAAAAEASAIHHGMLINRRVEAQQMSNDQDDDVPVTAVYPLAKTVLEVGDLYGVDAEDTLSIEAERAHLLYQQRQKRLDELESQSKHRLREPSQASLPPQKAGVLSYGVDSSVRQQVEQLASSYRGTRAPMRGERLLRTKSVPPEHMKKATPAEDRHSLPSRGRGTQQQTLEDTFRMDLYGRF
ncbi:hypothetical protein BBJ28_00000598 [Nothophytophthora sp. Chile5]|nr:hypothetical protein BBJ28_00000598 [Nothophytophthora sp. Chile5]